MKSKICSICKVEKLLTNFHSDKSSKDGYVGLCKSCKSLIDKERRANDPNWKTKSLENSRRFRAANPGYDKEKARQYRKKYPERVKEQKARYAKKHPERDRASKKRYQEKNAAAIREAKYFRQYGITLEEYEALLAKQSGMCAICSKRSKKHLAIDHDHKTGKVRGLLCGRCNLMLGSVADSITLLERAIRYLKQE